MVEKKREQKKQATASFQRKRFTLEGKVLRVSLEKTIKVRVTKKMRHPVYQKVITKSKHYLVHDEANLAKLNDWVQIISSRKFSKKKAFVLLKVLKPTTPLSSH